MEQEELRTPAGDGEELAIPDPAEVAPEAEAIGEVSNSGEPGEVGEPGESEKEKEGEVEEDSNQTTPLEAIEAGLEALVVPEAGDATGAAGATEGVLAPPSVEASPTSPAVAPGEPASVSAVQAEDAPLDTAPAGGDAGQPVLSMLAVDAGRLAADALAAEYRKLPGVVAGLIGGNTVEEVAGSLEAARKAFGDVKALVLKELGVGVPSARSGAGPAPLPSTPLGMIEAGLATTQARRNGSR